MISFAAVHDIETHIVYAVVNFTKAMLIIAEVIT